jgi:hypothetical protein
MPRALRGRFEALDHFVLGHLYNPWASLALGSPQAAKRFIDLAIGVRGKVLGSVLREPFPARYGNGQTDASALIYLALGLSLWARCCHRWRRGSSHRARIAITLFTMRKGTIAQQRIMTKSFSARSGIDAFPHSRMDRWPEPPTTRLFRLIRFLRYWVTRG